MIKDLASCDSDEAFLRDISKTGGTCIIDPRAEVVVGPMAGNEEGILYADADFEACIRGRMVHDVAGHYNRPDVYRLLVNNNPSSLVFSPQREQNGTNGMHGSSSALTNDEDGSLLSWNEPARLVHDSSQ